MVILLLSLLNVLDSEPLCKVLHKSMRSDISNVLLLTNVLRVYKIIPIAIWLVSQSKPPGGGGGRGTPIYN